MKVSSVAEKSGWKVLVKGRDADIHGVFCGDLLSWVMGHGQPEQAWVTVQSHTNVIAVALLREFSCLILAGGAVLEEEALKRATEEQLTVLSSPDDAFECCRKLIELGLS